MGKSPELGFGIMRMPQQGNTIDWIKSKKLIDEYMKGTWNYFDTHPAYMMGQSQRIIKEFVVSRYSRNCFFLANKMPYYGIKKYEDYNNIFLQELYECGVEYFDYYMLHAVSKDIYEMHEKAGGFRFLSEIKKKGRAKRIGISYHDSAILLQKILSEHPELDFVQLQINYMDWDSPLIQAKECYEIAHRYGKDIIVMEPIKGGSLAWGDNSKEYARRALQFVKHLSGVKIILSGMTEVEHICQNRDTLSRDDETDILDFSIYREMQEEMKRKNIIACTECKYCVRECPRKIKIPDIISLLNSVKRPGCNDKTAYGRMKMIYTNMTLSEGAAGLCTGCGACEKRCPQKIEIRKYLKEAVNMFEKEYFYTSERNAQILIFLMREYGIKKIVVSPGATNASFVYSLQQDGFFEIYSAPDERSAAYIACGLAVESNEIVALSCTGATASRNYVPGLTEAFYRNIPILAITSSQPSTRIGHNLPQVVDRTKMQNDIVKMSVELPVVKDDEDEWVCTINANKAINELNHRSAGPVHINLVTNYKHDYTVKVLPHAAVIRRIQRGGKHPLISANKIAVFCGAHCAWSDELVAAVDSFCEKYKAVVICDHTSNYAGKYRYTPIFFKKVVREEYLCDFDLLIHIGSISGAYFTVRAKEVWRVHPSGEFCDTFRSLSYIFEMDEHLFFEEYTKKISEKSETVREIEWPRLEDNFWSDHSKMPFSNAWIASQTAQKLPENSVLHLGILNTLRVWNFYKMPQSVRVYANTGGFGIDGCLSTLIGASLANDKKIFYGVMGDLAFFYDMNSLGNHHIGNNIRLLVINNGCGTEFKNYNHSTHIFGKQTDLYIAAKGHYGNKSERLLKDYAEDLGFLYKKASKKEEYLAILPDLVCSKEMEKSIVVEIFVESEAESDALKILNEDNQVLIQKREEELTLPEWLGEMPEKEIVLWGVGQCFARNISRVEQYSKIRYVCDNDVNKWNTEVFPGIRCISPEQIKKRKNAFVVIMLDDARQGFDIVHQLQGLGISYFDMVDKWLKYASGIKWKDSYDFDEE